jgi:hypothetical protein
MDDYKKKVGSGFNISAYCIGFCYNCGKIKNEKTYD